MILKDKKILLGVTGGIAAFKAASLVSGLKKQKAQVKVIMTEGATHFVSPLTFQTLSNNPVHIEQFDQMKNMDVEHIALAKWADIIVVAPATANTIAKINWGIGDNLLTTVLLAKRCPVLIVPAMNTYMLKNEQTQKNLEDLKKKGFLISSTQNDLLACGDVGQGKMLEPSEIIDLIEYQLTEKDLFGKKFVITAGRTEEALDPVRFLSNHSSGKMGFALAKEAFYRGAHVVLIKGPVENKGPKVDKTIDIISTEDMFNAVKEEMKDADVIIKAAAPADYRPKFYQKEKIKKNSEKDMTLLELEKNPDIAKYVGQVKENRVLVGFAAESTNELEYGKNKLASKNMDLIVINNIKSQGAGFKSDTNIASIIDKSGNLEKFDIMSKEELAKIIIDKVKVLLK